MEEKQPKKKLLKRFLPYYRPHIKLFIADMVCAFVVAVFNLIYPYITKEIINTYVPGKMLSALLIAAGVLFAAYVIKAFLNYVMQYWGHVVGVRIQADMRRELFDHLQKLPFSYYDENKTGVIMNRMTSDLFSVCELAHHGPEDVLLSILTIVGAFVVLCTINVYLALITFAFIPLIVIFVIFMRQRMVKVYDEVYKMQAEINAEIESAVSGVRVSRAYTAEPHEKDKFAAQNKRFVSAKSRQYKVMGEFFSSMSFLMDFLYFAVMIGGGLFYYYSLIDVGEFTAFVLYISAMISPIRTLTTIYEQIQDGATGFRRFTDIMDTPAERECEHPVALEHPKGDIRFENVTFSYQNSDGGKNIVSGFSLHIPAGKTVALVGPSGGGKTTLCHLIPRFYDADSGKITIDGTDVKELSLQSLRRNVGIVQQDVFLFNGTIGENIAYGNFNATQAEIEEAAKKAEIHDYIATLPNGYNTNVGERGVKLSGGQKQRISIARAFLKNPPILILDEATSALDNVTEAAIQASLDKLSEGRTTLTVAHRLTTVQNADEIVVITKEGVAERGTHDQLMRQNGIYAGLYLRRN